jgi:hypothetical protein
LACLALFTSFPPAVSAHPQRQETPAAPAATIITVNTSADLDSGSLTKTCGYDTGVFNPAVDGCTLRRAILEAAARPPGDRPIEIRFNLPANDPNKDLEVAGTWTLPVDDTLPPLKTASILNQNGAVTMDGATQPGGRSTGPKIIIDTNDNSLQVESENNIIRNLSFKGGGVIFLKEDGNLVEKIWMGLSDDGNSIAFRTPGDPKRMAGGGIFISSNDNIVQNNVISGAFAKAVDIGSNISGNIVRNNLIGTRANGTVPAVPEPAQCLRSFDLDEQNWYGGWGIALSGSNNQVTGNRIAGLHILQSANDTPPMALEIFGQNHLIQNNVIGVDAGGAKVGVCGQGIKVSGSRTQILDNIVVRSRAGFEDDESTAMYAIDSSPTFGRITVRGNIVEDGPGNIYAFGPLIPAVLRAFNPAQITSISGTVVKGGNGDGSACPNCLIDLYRDDSDAIAEALVYLGSATASSSGAFTFTMSQTLPAGTGLRTSSTTQSAGIIGSFGAGTTTKFSQLYLPMSNATVTVIGATTGSIGNSYGFTATVSPASVTTPLTYTVTATDFAPQVLTTNSLVVVATFTWTTPGAKTVTVTVQNGLGQIVDTFQVNLTGGGGAATKKLYLPHASK